MNNEIEFQAKYKQKTYIFSYGSQSYIFHTGVYNEIDKKYGLKTLLNYVSLTHNCYLSDSNRTPLGALADFIAQNWKKVKCLDKYELLNRFYETEY